MLTLKRLFFLFVIALFPIILFSQQKTYKVVCDKNDHKVKVVESTNHSPDLIPLKAGFPFGPVARKWAQENYPSGTCDPQKILDSIKQAEHPSQPTTNQQISVQQIPQPPNTQTVTQSSVATNTRKKFKNASLAAMLLIHNMDEVLGVEESNLGSGISFEQIFGQKPYYGGIGSHFNVYSLKHGGEKFDTYLFKFPIFAGYRISSGNFIVSFDAGCFISTKLNFFDEEYERFLREDVANSTSFSFFPRVRAGVSGFQIEAGAQFGLSDVVENREKLNVYFIGLRFCF